MGPFPHELTPFGRSFHDHDRGIQLGQYVNRRSGGGLPAQEASATVLTQDTRRKHAGRNGMAAGVPAYLAHYSVPAAALVGGGAVGSATLLFNSLIGR